MIMANPKGQIPKTKSKSQGRTSKSQGRHGWVFGLFGILIWSLVFGIWVLFSQPLHAQINMPDPSMIAGKALPAPELPNGTISVRVVREALGNNIVGQDVTVRAGGVTRSGKTDEQGRAQVAGFPGGTQGTAEATVDGERLVSDPFQVPESGGLRIILISGLKEAAERRAKEQAAEAAAPPVKGTVVIGGDSRVMMEFRDDELTVFYFLEIINNARNRVDIGKPFVVDLPEDATTSTLLQGSSPTASVRGQQLLVAGPFASGTTHVQVAFGLPHESPNLTLTQKFPAPMEQVLAMVQKVGSLQMSSPHFTETDEATAGNGTPFILGGGQRLEADTPLTIHLSNLPVAPAWPRQLALGLGVLIVVLGLFIGVSRGAAAEDAQRRLADRRESLFGELVKLEEQRRAGRVDGSKYASRRQKLMADLERVYGELDTAA